MADDDKGGKYIVIISEVALKGLHSRGMQGDSDRKALAKYHIMFYYSRGGVIHYSTKGFACIAGYITV